jgi:hypothetical protein
VAEEYLFVLLCLIEILFIEIVMEAIRIQKIDGQEFVPYKDYLRLKEENKNLNIIIKNAKIEQKSDREHIEELEEENKKLKEKLEQIKETYIKFEDSEKEYNK